MAVPLDIQRTLKYMCAGTEDDTPPIHCHPLPGLIFDGGSNMIFCLTHSDPLSDTFYE